MIVTSDVTICDVTRHTQIATAMVPQPAASTEMKIQTETQPQLSGQDHGPRPVGLPVAGPAEGGTGKPEGLLTRRQFAARCQIDLRTLDRWQAEGVVPFIKVGDIVRFHWPSAEARLLTHYTVLHEVAAPPAIAGQRN